jgi:hypothetical protein
MNRFLSRRIGISLMLFAVAVFALQFTTAAIAHAQGAAPPARRRNPIDATRHRHGRHSRHRRGRSGGWREYHERIRRR